MRFMHQHANWPDFRWDSEQLFTLLGAVRAAQGRLLGNMEGIGFTIRQDVSLEALSVEVVQSHEIEGERLPLEQVRSSVAEKLGVVRAGTGAPNRSVDAAVEVLLDAVQGYQQPLTKARLFAWHSALFPTGRSGLYAIDVGRYRRDAQGPMEVVSGPMGKKRVHFQAPTAERLPTEMQRFLDWLNMDATLEPVLKAGIAHLWFVTIHPFDDGNGRLARVITDYLLAQSEQTTLRFYSMSASINAHRKGYYAILEKTQKGNLDITRWLNWFLEILLAALQSAQLTLKRTLEKQQFWLRHKDDVFNLRQLNVINRLFDDFYGKLTSSKWAKMNKCSQDTALRDINDLLIKGVLEKEESGGRSTAYRLRQRSC